MCFAKDIMITGFLDLIDSVSIWYKNENNMIQYWSDSNYCYFFGDRKISLLSNYGCGAWLSIYLSIYIYIYIYINKIQLAFWCWKAEWKQCDLVLAQFKWLLLLFLLSYEKVIVIYLFSNFCRSIAAVYIRLVE